MVIAKHLMRRRILIEGADSGRGRGCGLVDGIGTGGFSNRGGGVNYGVYDAGGGRFHGQGGCHGAYSGYGGGHLYGSSYSFAGIVMIPSHVHKLDSLR